MNSPSTHPTDRLSLCSASSYTSSSTNSYNNNENRLNSSISKRSSNLKKSDQTSTRAKSPKSVSFNIDDNKDLIHDKQQQQQQINIPIEENKSLNETITSPIITNSNEISRENSDLIPELFKQHHHQVTNKQNIGYKLGK